MKHRIALCAFALFLLVDVGLFWAVRQRLDDSRTPVADDVVSSAPSQEPSAEPESAAVGSQSLELSGSGLLARVSQGRCTDDSRPLIEISADRGVSFDEVALPLLEEVDTAFVGAQAATVRTIQQVRAESVDEITVIGSDEQCRARQFVTDDGGSTWKQSKIASADDPQDDWYVDAAGSGVVSSEGATEPGCAVVSLSTVSDRNAKVACADGDILGTNDFGAEWVRLGGLEEVAGLTFDSLRDGFAVAPDTDCEVRLLTTADAGGQWTPAGCIAEKGEASALVGTSARLYALVDGEVQVSPDSGETWALPQGEPED